MLVPPTEELSLLQPDLFPLKAEKSSGSAHRTISGFLSSDQLGHEAGAWLKHRGIATDQELLLAAVERLVHIAQSEPLLGRRFFALRRRLEWLLFAVMSADPELSEPAVVALLEALPQSNELNLQRPFELASVCVERCGFTPGLVRGLKILASVASKSVGQQALRKKVDALLLKSPLSNPKPARCWSELVRADIAAMPEAQGCLWADLLATIHTHNSPFPSQKWERQARNVLARLGQNPFEIKLTGWFDLLQAGGPFGLTTAGSYFMRTLLWYAGLEPSRAGIHAVECFTKANWKSTQAMQSALGPVGKVAAASALLLVKYPPAEAIGLFRALEQKWGYPESRVRGLYSEAARKLGLEVVLSDHANPYEIQIDGLKAQMNRGTLLAGLDLGPRVEVRSDCLIVSGQLDRYHVDRTSLSIRRLSDAATGTADFTLVENELAKGLIQEDATLVAILLLQDEPRQTLRFSAPRSHPESNR